MGKLVMGRSQFRAHPRRDQQGLLGHVGMAHVGVSWFLLVRLETTMACNTASWKDAAGSAPLNNPHHSRGIHNNAGHLSCKSNVGTRRCKLGVQVDGARSLAKRYPEVGVGLKFGRGLRKHSRSGVPRRPGPSASCGSSLGRRRRLEHEHRIDHVAAHLGNHLEEHVVALVFVFDQRILLAVAAQAHRFP